MEIVPTVFEIIHTTTLDSSPSDVQTVDLHISIENLSRPELLAGSDSLVAGYVLDQESQDWFQLGMTEQIKGDKNPKFINPIPAKFYFNEIQKFKFFIVDSEDTVPRGKGELPTEIIGEVTLTLAEILNGNHYKHGFSTQVLSKGGKKVVGTLRILAKEVDLQNRFLEIKFSASNVDKKDRFGKSDPFLIINRAKDEKATSWEAVHTTPPIKNTLDPVWDSFTIPLNRLCFLKPEWPLFIECYDWNQTGRKDLIGNVRTTLKELETKKNLELIEPKLKAKKKGKYTNSGILNVDVLQSHKLPSFLDYVTEGTELNFVVGIDYTASNGDPDEPGSLHNLEEDNSNNYISVIKAVGEIISAYDSDQRYYAFGFGAYLARYENQINHCFAINGDESTPECIGLQGVIDAYKKSFDGLSLGGPTNFAPIINRVAELSSKHTNGDKWHILLMVTDGEITDFDRTADAIIQASELPMSIIIVGVGDREFNKMRIFDADNKEFAKQNGFTRDRDIVQFVEFNKYRPTRKSDSNSLLASQLAKDTLKEVPTQLVTWMRSKKILPGSFKQKS